MIRALVIRLGEVLAPIPARLSADHDALSRRADVAPDSKLEVLDAPVAAVGNLSRPVQVLREQLEADLVDRLTRLLALSPATGEDFVLDVFIILNLGEPLVANATRVVIEMLEAIVDKHFRTIFPRHRVGTARRFRVIPIATLPSAPDCEKDRDAALDELQALHDVFREGRDEGQGEFFVDRVFLLDAMTSRGIASVTDLVDQVLSFLRLAILGGVRRTAEFVRLFEAEHEDLFASFGIACCEVDFEAVARQLTQRMTAAVARELGTAGTCALPATTELLPLSALDDPDALEAILTELDALPGRTLGVEGSAAVRPLADLYDTLGQRIDAWRRPAPTAVIGTDTAATPAPAATGTNAAGIGLVVAVLGGVAISLAAHFFALASTSAVVASGGGFAVFAFLLTWLVLRRGGEAPEERPTPNFTTVADEAVDDEQRGAVLDALEHTVDGQRTRLTGMAERFEGIARAFETDPDDPADGGQTPGGTFRDPLTTAELLDLVYERRLAAADARAVADAWLTIDRPWDELLSGAASPEAADLERYCADHFRSLAVEPLFSDLDARSRVSDCLKAFLDRWAAGVHVSLEGESRKQFDPDGFDRPISQALFASGDLAPELRMLLGDTDTILHVHPSPIRIDDVFLLTAVTDVHPDAVAALADRENRP